MYETLTFTGGIHKSEELKELIEDLGGFVLQSNILQMELVLNMAVPIDDVDIVKQKAKELLGELSVAPMAGSEIAIVSPTLARHHLPHAACDISEYLRRYGAKDNMVGLARGHGKGTAGISETEKALIEEHDIAIFALGSFKQCIIDKAYLYNDIDIPVIVTGAPEIDLDELPGVDAYVPGLGRIPRRLKRGENIRALKKLVETVEDLLEKLREKPGLTSCCWTPEPAFLIRMLRKRMTDIFTSPTIIIVAHTRRLWRMHWLVNGRFYSQKSRKMIF